MDRDIKSRIKAIKEEDYFSKANLHCHSSSSDGVEEFGRMVERALEVGLENFAISDHNTVSGYKNFRKEFPAQLIPAVEFDCFLQTTLIHILGYGIDFNSPEVNEICAHDTRETKSDIIRLFRPRHPKKVIEAIHKAGGIAVFAHPCCSSVFSLTRLTKKLVSFGLDGIEVYYPYNRHRGIIKFHSRKKPFRLAEEFDLIKTGGTDEHGRL